jgi:hypothetical protein
MIADRIVRGVEIAARDWRESRERKRQIQAPASADVDAFEREIFAMTPEELVVTLRRCEPGSLRSEQIGALLALHEVRQARGAARTAGWLAAIATCAAVAQAIVAAV